MITAVIFAGGVGKRMHSKDIPKQFLKLHDKPIIIHTLEIFEKSSYVDSIVISCLKDYMGYLNDLIIKYNLKKVQKIVPGGRTGQESIYHGLKAASNIGKRSEDIVLIHDGVRPLISDKTIKNNINGVRKYGSAITSVKAKETIIVVDKNENIKSVNDRSRSRLARAPQSFYLDDILSIHERAIKEGKNDFIDSCSMMQFYGKKLHLVDGPQENIKITTPDDFYTMRALLDAKENAQIYGLDE
ncbi:2-C-methyl-D-erythritol 4-phosphate cytidylyltransferase [Limosilactobacillus reuteri]|uniref:IspD/TarI family cytidylyltransferase n=1 Tax=Limosilactobacillus reuteri TaxID=1598 RepID=UPI00117DB827|nr:IspD/TarI family cytidylyltransferase [Limosilactobacillus reuteri]MCC4346852.1 2-C-methyl-D-erythritol 4-phosphate cytidylyltransferase [Limosilactobacillus reuteri]MCT3203231.1 2-C-methyl-D-erythritol 4-phosphate cytidylyltransferase [Limosilactobacillus reuteri]MCT3211832.1 2-C-methyl-D-erythritol 4-phosphate cytidylyltransferase [Limosilactobacillus reuteri]TSB18832.1 2-C-methyl-D-erythritol 4-phosphate cytidylyltransferase [Limosilactobacillus reuteri]UAW61708.1 2-C-methyl-D-erythritol